MFPVARIKETFFDRPGVAKWLDARNRRGQIKIGAYVRRTAVFSMKSREGTAPVGSPPFAHEKSLKRMIFFGYDEKEKSTVIGPVLTDKHSRDSIPLLLEVGGTAMVKDEQGKDVELTYDEHPYMKPALDENIAKLKHMYE